MTKGVAIQFFQDYAQRNLILVNEIVKPAGTAKIMSSSDISSWYEAVQLYEAGRVDEAIEKFKSVKQNSKMLLNIGCCYLRKSDLNTASETYMKAVTSDPHSALGFFFLGLSHHFQNRYDKALKSFEKSLTLLRGNKFVDYRQLGFNFQLYSCEILTNLAATYLRLDDINKATESLQKAFENKAEKRHERIFEAIQGLQSGKPIHLFFPPQSEIFRPSKAAVSNIKKKDYLGEAKVISTDSDQDCYACFSGIKDKVNEQKKAEQENKRQRSSAVNINNNNNNNNKEKETTPVSMAPSAALTLSGETISEEEKKPRSSSTAPTPPPKTPLPARPLSCDVIDGSVLKSPRSPKPRKPLPRFPTEIKTNESVPRSSSTQPTVPQSWIVDLNNNITEDEEEELEVQIQYSFVKKIRLPKGFTVADLETNAVKETIPTNLEFRMVDSLGRQIEVTSEEVFQQHSSKSDQVIQCFPTL